MTPAIKERSALFILPDLPFPSKSSGNRSFLISFLSSSFLPYDSSGILFDVREAFH